MQPVCNSAHLYKAQQKYPRDGERLGWNGNCDSGAQLKLTSSHVNTSKCVSNNNITSFFKVSMDLAEHSCFTN